MSDGPPTDATLPLRDGGPYLLQVVADLSDLKARVAVVERNVPELAARLDGRFAALEAQVARTQDHLAQQDHQQAAFRLEVKSGLGTLQAAEQLRAAQAKEAADRAQEAQQQATERAAEQRAETRRWALQTLASATLVVPSIVWPLVVTHPLLWRLGVPAACVALVLALAALAWLRSR